MHHGKYLNRTFFSRLSRYNGDKQVTMVTEKRVSRMKRTFFIDNVKKYVCLINTANSEWKKHPYQKLLHFVMFYTIGKLFFGYNMLTLSCLNMEIKATIGNRGFLMYKKCRCS